MRRQIGVGRRGPEALHSDDETATADEAAQGLTTASLDRHDRGAVVWNDRVLISIGLFEKESHTRHRDDPCADPVRRELQRGLDRDTHLGPRREQDDIRLFVRFRNDVRALPDVRGIERGWPFECRHGLTSQGKEDRARALLQVVGVGHRRLDPIRGTEDRQSRYDTKAIQLFDWLMRRAILANEDRIVGKDEERPGLHQCGQPNRRPHVVTEDHERAAIG